MKQSTVTAEMADVKPETAGENGKKAVIRVLVADDHPIVREGIRKLLELEDDVEVVAEAGEGREVLELVNQVHPDIVLLDLKMPGMDGLGVLQTLQHLKTNSKTIVLTASEDKNGTARPSC